ncbi:hypothetical protein BT69DRAFT_1329148 [Atractiella rhizophila]|nr:hypothetical protein BT69DRAFT_1329148 [Atractiella rhizophila]
MGNNPSKEKKNGHAPGLGGPYDDSSATRSTSSRRSKLALDFDPSAQGASSNQGSPVIPISPSLPKQGVTGVSAVGKSSRRFEGDGVYASLSKKGKTSKAEGKEKDDRGWRNPIMGRESGPTTPSPTKPTLSPKPLSPLSPRIPTFQLASESDLTPVVAPVVPEQFSERKPNEDAEIADDLSAARKDGELEEEALTSSIRPLKSTINVLQPSSNPSTPLKGLGNIPLGAMDDQESARLLVDSLPIGLSLPPALPPPSTPNTSISIVMPSSPPLLTPFPLPSTPMTLEHVDKGTPTIPLNHLPEETVIAKAVPPLELRELGKVVLLGGKGGEGLELEVAQESERAREEAVKATLEEPIVDDKIDVKGLDITHTDVIQALSTVPLPPDDPLPAVPHATLQSPIPTSRYPQTAPLLAIADSVATALSARYRC